MIQKISSNLARILNVRQFLTDEDQDKWLSLASSQEVELDEILLRENIFERSELLKILENHFFVQSCDLKKRYLDPSVAQHFPEKLARRHLVLPLDKKDEVVRVIFANPDDKKARESIEHFFRKEIVRLVALPTDLINAIDSHYENDKSMVDDIKRVDPQLTTIPHAKAQSKVIQILTGKLENKVPIEVVNEVLYTAVECRATDIHLQPAEHELTVRYRVDGVLYTVAHISKDIVPAVISRVKVIAGMDLAEHRLPQDGRYNFKREDVDLDLRISLLPSQFGEKIVIRILRKYADLFVLDNLQMPPAVRTAFQDVLKSPQGFYLVTGPTGSGKTTTLYATLNSLDNQSSNIVTLENPIEYSFPGFTQVQTHEEIGLNFTAGLRCILRQDPDVILIGEIRDAETADIACRSALTGHKVFSTLHTNDSCQAITRLLDLGTPAFLIAATLKGVLAQRLVRTICIKCRESYTPRETDLLTLGKPEIKELYRGKGCKYCNWTGYKGRKAIFEYFTVTEDIHRLIIERASPYVIRHAAQKAGMLSMREFAIGEAVKGVTSVEEIQRTVLSSQDQEQLCPNCMQTVSLDFSICPFCQSPLRERCTNCGQIADPNWQACPKCGHEFEHEWKKTYCHNCLAPIHPDWYDCEYCGVKIK